MTIKIDERMQHLLQQPLLFWNLGWCPKSWFRNLQADLQWSLTLVGRSNTSLIPCDVMLDTLANWWEGSQSTATLSKRIMKKLRWPYTHRTWSRPNTQIKDHGSQQTQIWTIDVLSLSGKMIQTVLLLSLKWPHFCNCRFLVGNQSKSVSPGFESLFMSSVPLHRASKPTPSLLCVARKIVADSRNSQQSQSQMHQQSLLQGPPNQYDIFSTRLDPSSFRITYSSTDKVSLSSRVSSMSGKSFLEFCYHEDQDIVRAHFLETLQSTNEVSPTLSKPYRIIGLLDSPDSQHQQRFVRVQTRSKYIKQSNHQVIIVLSCCN